MVHLNDIYDLPESVRPELLKPYFEAIIRNTHGETQSTVLDALQELSDKQWHTYTLIDPELAEGLHQWLVTHWDGSSADFTGTVIGMIGHLGLEKSFVFLKEQCPLVSCREVREEIETFILESDGHIADPYHDLRPQ